MSDTFDDRERDTSNPYAYDTPQQVPRSGCSHFAMGCGCGIGCLLLVVIGIGVWLAMSWKGFAANITKQAAADAVAKSSLTPDDKARVLKRINQLADDFEAGKVSTEQVSRVMQQVANSPLLPLGMVMAADENYLKPSGLSAEEKEAGRRTLQRLARGAFEKRISERDTHEVMKLVMERQPDGREQIKNRLTDDELKAFLEKAKEKADASAVPDEPFDVNIADEIEKAIDNALKP